MFATQFLLNIKCHLSILSSVVRSKNNIVESVTFTIVFSNSEKYDVIIVYGACDENAARTKILCRLKYPDRSLRLFPLGNIEK